MALAVVQAQHAVATTATAVTVPITSTAGNLLVIYAGQNVNTSATLTVTDSTGGTNVWSQAGSNSPGTTSESAMFYSPTTAGVTSVTATWSGPISGRVNAVVYEISGAATSSLVDATVNKSQGTATSLVSGSLTTTNANDILLFGINFSANITADTAGAGFTFPTNGDAGLSGVRIDMDFEIVSATQSGLTTTTTWTTNAATSSIFAAFKAAVAGTYEDDSFSQFQPPPVDPTVSVW